MSTSSFRNSGASREARWHSCPVVLRAAGVLGYSFHSRPDTSISYHMKPLNIYDAIHSMLSCGTVVKYDVLGLEEIVQALRVEQSPRAPRSRYSSLIWNAKIRVLLAVVSSLC